MVISRLFSLAVALIARNGSHIEFDPNDFRFAISEGEFGSLTGVLHVSNSGGGTLNWSVSGGVNVTLSPISGSSTGERHGRYIRRY